MKQIEKSPINQDKFPNPIDIPKIFIFYLFLTFLEKTREILNLQRININGGRCRKIYLHLP